MRKTEMKPQKAHRAFPVRLLLMLLSAIFLVLWLFPVLESLLSLRRIPSAFSAEPSSVSALSIQESTENRLDINQASADELDMLPGIGPSLAQAIIEYREVNGPFFYLEEIMDVPGIGEKRFTDISPLIDCSPPSQ